MGNMKTAVMTVLSGVDAPADMTATPVVFVNEDGDVLSAVVMADAQANSTASTVADLKTDFNALLAKLRTAGVIDT